jgi:GWxTD domain-containing protein
MLQDGSRAEGYAAYRAAIDTLDGRAAALFYQDVSVLVNPQEAAEWKRATTPARQRLWLERFWERRAADGGVTVEERVAEHYRRLAEARARYVRNARRGSDNPTGSRLLAEQNVEGHIFDDRGVVLIRHGSPSEAVRTGVPGVLPNETWAYHLPGQDEPQLFHFVAVRGAQDFSLVGDILQAVDPDVLRIENTLRSLRPGTRAVARRDGNTERDLRRRELAVMALIEDRAVLDSRYRQGISRLRQLLQSGHPLDGTEVRSIVERNEAEYRRGAREALRTDSHVRSFEKPLAFHHDVFSFRTPAGRTEATAAVAVPADELEPLAASGNRVYALALSLIMNDTLQDVITRLDTIQQVRLPAAPAPGDFVRAHVTLPVVPSEHTTYRLVVGDAIGPRGGMESGGSRIRDFGGRRMVLSDVVLALPDSAGDWRRGDVRLELALPRHFGAERPFTVFYEVYNLPADAPYETRVVVTPFDRGGLLDRVRGLFGGGGSRLDLRFDDVARPDADGAVQEVRRLASDLPAGRYRLEVTVTATATGESATSSTVFRVED